MDLARLFGCFRGEEKDTLQHLATPWSAAAGSGAPRPGWARPSHSDNPSPTNGFSTSAALPPPSPGQLKKITSGASTSGATTSASGRDLISAAWQRLSASASASILSATTRNGTGASGAAAAAAAPSEDQASTSYPSWVDGDADGTAAGGLSATVLSAREAESALDFVLEGSLKGACILFRRYDMDLDGELRAQDLYDLLLELSLALAYEDYQRLVDFLFAAADVDRDGRLCLTEFVPLYRLLCLARRAFKRQDHHWNGQIDRYDFVQVLYDLGVIPRPAPGDQTPLAAPSPSPQPPSAGLPRGGRDPSGSGGGQRGQPGGRVRELVEHSFSIADRAGRGTVNFSQLLLWYAQFLHVVGLPSPPDENGDIEPPASGLAAPIHVR